MYNVNGTVYIEFCLIKLVLNNYLMSLVGHNSNVEMCTSNNLPQEESEKDFADKSYGINGPEPVFLPVQKITEMIL